MKNAIITGSNGMIGSLILKNCLENFDVKSVTTIVRKKSGIVHPKLTEICHSNFEDFSTIESHFKNQDLCFYCVGVYTGKVPREEFAKITIDYTKSFAEMLRRNNESTTFCFLSGQGADRSGSSKLMFAKDKGIAENLLFDLNFDQLYSFRPGYIYPTQPRTEPNFFYKLMRVIYLPFLSKVYPNIGVSSEKLAETMVAVGLNGSSVALFENKDIRLYKKS